MTGRGESLVLAPDEIQCLVLILIGVACAMAGTFLVIKKMTMLANSISHTILFGIVITFYFFSSFESDLAPERKIGLLLLAAGGTALLTTLVTEFLHRVAKWEEDASIGIVFTSFFALGILLVNLLTRNAHIGVEIVMGNVDALHQDDLKLSGIIFLIVLASLWIPFRGWKLAAFDEAAAKLFGWCPGAFHYALMLLASLTVVGGLRAVGVLMVLNFMIVPPLISRLFFSKLHRVLLGSMAISVGGTIAGVALSRHLLTVYDMAVSTGGLIAVLFGTTYLILALATTKYAS